MNRPRVSVVIPTYNSGRFVTEAVESVLAQTAPPAEVIVVDDGSTDDTAGRLAAYSGRVRYLRQANAGVAAARNLGVREAAGDLVAFLDADDVWHRRKLELHLAAWDRAGGGLGLLGTGSFPWPSGPTPALDDATAAEPEFLTWSRVAVSNPLMTSATLACRGVLLRAGLFDVELQGPEDHDLWIRVAEVARVARIALPLTGYREVDGSLSKRGDAMHQGMMRILRKIDARGAWGGRPLLRRRAYGYAYYSSAYLDRVAGLRGKAARHLASSFAWWPLPLGRAEARYPCARVRLLASLARGIEGGAS